MLATIYPQEISLATYWPRHWIEYHPIYLGATWGYMSRYRYRDMWNITLLATIDPQEISLATYWPHHCIEYHPGYLGATWGYMSRYRYGYMWNINFISHILPSRNIVSHILASPLHRVPPTLPMCHLRAQLYVQVLRKAIWKIVWRKISHNFPSHFSPG